MINEMFENILTALIMVCIAIGFILAILGLLYSTFDLILCEKKERRKRKARYELEPCPKCGGLHIDVWKTVCTKKYHLECRKCNYASRSSRFLFVAKKRWNKEELFDDNRNE
jgi:hypothetical protein